MPRCVDCLGEATIEIQSPEGVPVGWFCDDHWAETQRLHDAVMKLPEDGVKALEVTP